MNEMITQPQQSESSAMVEIGKTRAAQEIQTAMLVAKRFPRDTTASYNRIMNVCKRLSLAQQAEYSYPKGGQQITGPSIRLAEALAREWGNINIGIAEVEQRLGESTMVAYAVDLETNFREERTFVVKHERQRKSGKVFLDDPRDIYEMTANQGARRLRACILAVIPGDIVDAAVEQCRATLAHGNGEPFEDRLRKMVTAFERINVTPAMLEQRLGHNLSATQPGELTGLLKIYNGIKDGVSKVEDWFEKAKSKSDDNSEKPKSAEDELAEKAAAAKARKEETVAKPTDDPTDDEPQFDEGTVAGNLERQILTAIPEDMGELSKAITSARSNSDITSKEATALKKLHAAREAKLKEMGL